MLRRTIDVEQNAMALFPALDADFDAQAALRLPLGAVSPLWFAFASAASAGVAYWWMTRWAEPANLEAFNRFAFRTAETPSSATATRTLAAQPTVATPVEAALEPVEAAADVLVGTTAALAEPATETVEETAQTVAATTDDLTRLVGVGPRLAERLGGLGVKNFRDIAAWTEADLASFDKALDLRGRASRDAWVAQARRFAED
jgi:predicted flap endonuclease-1-like 5' DNA nuclease